MPGSTFSPLARPDAQIFRLSLSRQLSFDLEIRVSKQVVLRGEAVSKLEKVLPVFRLGAGPFIGW